ncbi:MAG: DUF2116 family Zn-ribbon domain-containing protein [Gammaproteobacteria bacterium]|nr:DUF2116 family Zn-ribbon domain-containing protein [Gammaproteobacteria bacterium]NIR81995.1 DUF2116 family Zn-ribbon domain-containing protein [Gammaproteobacteria bacterium]NIR89052.1 DUF2116 family Zn-ribbon domain-containing protein [Gammaproteobacteria bacterium]NIU03102.1 DUF2116 family Zn-ribbon domain-containing protein [Gammaproteobacteria bacterium]NIV50626.1 DUF2116 family Zn-ribbon domain-containing protein [Gammaproteobacteria bacterium]
MTRPKKHCIVCGFELDPDLRSDAKTCSPKCRQRLYRLNKQQHHLQDPRDKRVARLRRKVDYLEEHNRVLQAERDWLRRELESLRDDLEVLSRQSRARPISADPHHGPFISRDMKRKILSLVHPDRHENDHGATEVAQWLNSLAVSDE